MHTDTRHPPATVPMHPSILHRRRRLQGSLQYTQASSNSTHRNSILSGRQHPHTYKIPQVHFYRILQGEIGFFPKGLSIANPCSTKVSVFQFINSCAENNSTRNLILSKIPRVLCKEISYYLSSK